MITRKRLEELIKEEKTIWIKNKYCNAYSYDLTNYNYVGIADNKESLMFLDFSIQEDEPDKILVDYLDYLFETKEEAEFVLEFQNITRTETLNLPTWEEFKNDGEFSFLDKQGFEWDLYSPDDKTIISLVSGYNHFEYEYSKKNYTIACRKAKELFLGENIDE